VRALRAKKLRIYLDIRFAAAYRAETAATCSIAIRGCSNAPESVRALLGAHWSSKFIGFDVRRNVESNAQPEEGAKQKFYGTGRRKESVARVFLTFVPARFPSMPDGGRVFPQRQLAQSRRGADEVH